MKTLCPSFSYHVNRDSRRLGDLLAQLPEPGEDREVFGAEPLTVIDLPAHPSFGCGPAAAPPGSRYYPGTEEAHTNPTRQRGECLRALAGASG